MNLLRVYRREWLGWLALLALFTLSFYLALREYRHYTGARRQLHLTRQRVREVRRAFFRMRSYAGYSFWRHLGQPQQVEILEKVELHPLLQAVNKLSDLYTRGGFFFLREFRLDTCLETSPGRRRRCRPYLLVRGTKVVF